MNDNMILRLSVLNSKNFFIDNLKPFLSGDKRRFERDIQKLISFNKKAFDFIGIKAKGEYNESFNYSLKLESSEYSGVIPIRSAGNGLVCGHLEIIGRYGENISSIIPLLQNDSFRPEFENSIPLKMKAIVNHPKYIECAKYIDAFEKAERFHWKKFVKTNITQARPRNTDWEQYSLSSYDPIKALRYPNKINFLTTEHPEWLALQYVLNLSILEITSARTPISMRMHYTRKIARLNRKYDKNSLSPVKHIAVHGSDPIIIKELKEQANLILSNYSNASCAWRINHSCFFERYVQYLFALVTQKIGANIINNPHYNISGKKTAWSLKYIEPDLVITKDKEQIVVDAKYKSHMYNTDANTEVLRNTFRDDFHQVLAYSSFNSMQCKKTMIIYPNKEFKCYPIVINSSLNDCKNDVFLIGVPISKVKISEIVNSLCEIV